MLIMIMDRYNFLIRIYSSLWDEKVPLIRGNKDCDTGKSEYINMCIAASFKSKEDRTNRVYFQISVKIMQIKIWKVLSCSVV